MGWMKDTVITAAVPAIPTWVSRPGAAAPAVARGLGWLWKLILDVNSVFWEERQVLDYLRRKESMATISQKWIRQVMAGSPHEKNWTTTLNLQAGHLADCIAFILNEYFYPPTTSADETNALSHECIQDKTGLK